MHDYVSFTVGCLTLGADLAAVASIEQGGRASYDPQGPLKLGTVPFEGTEVPVYNTALLFGEGGAGAAVRGAKTVILRLDSGAIALSVDGASRVMAGARPEVVEMPPVFSGLAKDLFPQVLRGPQGWIPLIDPEAVEPAAFSVQMKRVESEAHGAPLGIPEASVLASGFQFVGKETPEAHADAGALGADFSLEEDEPVAEWGIEAMAGILPPPGQDGDAPSDGGAPGARQEPPLVSDLLEAAITPDLLEKVVDRVVRRMVHEVVPDLPSELFRAKSKRKTRNGFDHGREAF